MTNEQSLDRKNMKNKSQENQVTTIKSNLFTYNKKINVFAFINLLFSYMRNVWLSTIITCIILPILPLVVYFVSIGEVDETFTPLLSTLFVLLLFSSSVLILSSTLTSIFIEIRSSVVFKRIGLISLKPIGYLFVFNLFSFLLIFWAHILVFICFSIFMAANKLDYGLMFNSATPTLIIFELCMLLVLSSLISLILVVVHNRGIANILVTAVLAVFMIIFFTLVRYALVPISRESFRTNLYSPAGWGVIIGFISINILIALGIWFATIKLFKWE